jgi:hypothetical protein
MPYQLINPLKPKLVQIISKTSNKQSTTLYHYKVNCLMLFEEIIFVSSENHIKPINTPFEQNAELVVVEAGGSCGYHWGTKGAHPCTAQNILKTFEQS